jgi:hypothetical protein
MVPMTNRLAGASIAALVFLCLVGFSQQEESGLPPASGKNRELCVACHIGGDPDEVPQVDPAMLERSIHQQFGCSDCHVGVRSAHGPDVPAVDCSHCHEETASGFRRGVHWRARRKGSDLAPDCITCHGGHDITSIDAEDSRMNRTTVADTCGQCHAQSSQEFAESIHAEALADAGKTSFAPTCTTCHGEHLIFDTEAPASPVSSTKLPSTCGGCHDDPEFAKAMGIPEERLESYKDSIHGLRNRFGEEEVATCKDCHGAHLVLPQNDPRSKVSSENIISTCGMCHEGANENFAAAKVHVQATLDSSPGVFAARWFYIIFIGILVLGFITHIYFDLVSMKRRKEDSANE